MRSCSSSILVQETAEQVTPVHLSWMILSDAARTGWVWRLQPQRPVWAMLVVVLHVDAQDPIQVPSPDDQEPVQALGTHRANPAFRMRVRVGCPHRGHHDIGALRAEHVIEAAAELRIAVAQEEAHAPSPLLHCKQQVASLLGDPGTVGVGGHPGQVDSPGVQFEEEQRVQASQPDGVSSEEVARDDPGSLLPQECTPRRSSRSRRRIQPMAAQGGAMAVTETRTPSPSSSPLMRW
jgi:hypothetical protein